MQAAKDQVEAPRAVVEKVMPQQLAEAEAALELATKQFQRLDALVKEESAPIVKRDEAEMAFKAAQANALARLRADATTRITLQVRKTWLDARETQQRIDVTSKAIDQAEENVRVAGNRYEKGQGTNTEVLDAETLRTLSHGNYFNAVYDAVLAVFRLRRAVGTL